MKRIFWHFAACISLLIGACTPKPEEADLVLLYTTDLHGAMLSWDINQNAPAKTSLAQVATYVKQERLSDAERVILLDAGDFLQGQPSVYYYNYIATHSEHLAAKVFNDLQYDAIAVGNHEIETGEEVYNGRLRRQFDMPWLAANAIDVRTGQPMFTPYTTFKKKGLKIAVLGMITPKIDAWLPKSLWPNLEFQDMVECAQTWIPIIKENENPDLLIGLFHAGVDYTVNGDDMDSYCNENGTVPAAVKVPGFDLCLAGHDHALNILNVANVSGDSVLIIDAQTQARYIGRVDIHFSRQEDGGYKKVMKPQMVAMADFGPDTDFDSATLPYVQATNRFVDEPVGELTDSIFCEDAMFGPSAFMDLIHEAQLWASRSDVSFASVLSRTAVVEKGPISMRHLFTLYKYENLLFKVNMTADEIRQYLEFGYNRQFNTMTSANDHLLNFDFDEDGQIQYNGYGPKLKTFSFNFTSAAGVRYTVDVSKPEGQRVKILSLSNGEPIDPQKLYSVAINSYQYSGGGQFIPEGLGWNDSILESRTIITKNIDVRRHIADYIQRHTPITPALRGDWQVIPTEWWEKGKQRDSIILNQTRKHGS
ncbi:MAG: 5'-nucleotidase C-terminal domain-containing protein [Bacteroidales bacterium]|nr:5'-nucleotidase C-terminal domain-containing protein [Bacteroidales bacterium]